MEKPPLEKKFIIWEDLWYAAEVIKPDTHYVTFKVFEIEGMGEVPTYRCDSGSCEGISSATVVMDGSIKWDHCMNMNFEQGNYAFHFCGKERALRIGTVLGRLYDEAEKLLGETWDS